MDDPPDSSWMLRRSMASVSILCASFESPSEAIDPVHAEGGAAHASGGLARARPDVPARGAKRDRTALPFGRGIARRVPLHRPAVLSRPLLRRADGTAYRARLS